MTGCEGGCHGKKKPATTDHRFERALAPTPPGSMMKVDIEYLSHEEGTKTRHSAFFGLTADDLPDGRFAAFESVTLTTHSGTHLDAPYHFGPTSEGKPSRTIDEIPLDWCFGDGVLLDFRHKKAGEEIGVKMSSRPSGSSITG